jgi:hypothetical protein
MSDIVEENGKTVKENNMAIQHNIPIGALVEVTFDTWHGNGACEVTKARLWVVIQSRDCDGTPLYWLSKTPIHEWNDSIRINMDDMQFKKAVSQSLFYNTHGGFSEENLKVIEVTDELKRGVDALTDEIFNDK